MGEQVAARSNGDVAQLGEHLPCKQGVESSNLFISTEIERFQRWAYSSAGRAPALQAGGQEFDPPHLHHRASEDEETTTVAEN